MMFRGTGAAAWTKLLSMALRGLTALLLIAWFLSVGQFGSMMWIILIWVVVEAGCSFGRLYDSTKRLISNAYFIAIFCFVVVTLLAERSTAPLVMIAMLANLAAWDVDALYWRMKPFEKSNATSVIVRRHLIGIAALCLLGLALVLTSDAVALTLSAWQNIGVGAVAIISLFIIISWLTKRFATAAK